MRKNLKSKILLSILAASVFYLPAYAHAASLEITNKTQATDSTISDWLQGKIFNYGKSDNAIYHATETEGNKLIITYEPEFLKNYPYLAAAHIKMDDRDNFTEAKLEKNEVTITSSNFAARHYVYGAYADLTGVTNGSKASLISNTIKVENGTFKDARFSGAYAVFNNNVNKDIQFNATAALQNNSVTVSGISFTSSDNTISTTIEGAYASIREIQTKTQANAPAVTLTGNTVTVNGNTTFSGPTDIYGARTEMRQNRMFEPYGITLSADLTGNTVTINDGTKFNGQTSIYGACADLNRSPNISTNNESSLTNNSVNINGGSFSSSSNSNIYGAYINLDSVQKADGGNSESTVSGNNVTIRGGTFENTTNVYGVYANLTKYIKDNEANHPGTVAISDNTVTLKGTASENLTKVNLYGYAYDNGNLEAGKDQITDVNGKKLSELVKDSELGNLNNNLIVDGWSGTVGSVNNFANINFENIKVAKSGEAEAKSEFYIEATGDKNKNLASTTVNINSIDTSNYNKGDTVSGTLTLDSDIAQNNIKISDSLNGTTYSVSDYGTDGIKADETSFTTTIANDTDNNHVITITGGISKTILAGKIIDTKGNTLKHSKQTAENASLTISENTTANTADVTAGAYASGSQAATGGKLIIDSGTHTGSLYGGYSENGTATNNTVTLTSGADVTGADLYGGGSGNASAEVTTGNTLTIDGWSGKIGSINNFANIVYENVSGNMELNATTVTGNNMSVVINSIPEISTLGGNLKAGSTINLAAITLNEEVNNAVDSVSLAQGLETGNTWIYSDYAPTSAAETIGGIYANNVQTTAKKENNTITVGADVKNTVLAGKFIDAGGTTHTNSSGVTDLTISEIFSTNASVIAGAYALGDNDATGGKVYMAGNYQGTVYAGYSEDGAATGNEIILTGNANVTGADLYGGYSGKTDAEVVQDNTLTVNDWTGSVNSLNNFAAIEFENIAWKPDTAVLTVAEKGDALKDTVINLKSINLAGGQTLNTGEKMTLITGAAGNNLAITKDNVTAPEDLSYLAGIAVKGTGEATVDENGTVTYTITSVELTPQTDMLAETHAATAAFVNQGTDLINDSLDVLGRDGTYGVKTFAAVHGNRSKYDVADDIKINGWSTIVGVGNADKFDNGSELSWGVFYENGSGNYRTYNSFNNEFFRGDGSLVYNGGGIAARYENKNGVYTEGSLRAGMLKNELDNAMRDVNGSYGYETESAYYGAHIGVGKIISLSDSSDLDIYGKFFHTYTEGDSVTIADDKFDFDSITSDRLRVGARITSNKENKFSTYYGLAYEYEFNGDADMTAQGLRADTQSLQGSSVMAEVGFNYQPTPDSPWSFDLNMRGYTGERQGGSFNVQATYTF